MVMRLFNTELAFRSVALDRGVQGSRQAQELRRRWWVRGSHRVDLEKICKEVDVTDEVKIKQDNDKADEAGRHARRKGNKFHHHVSTLCLHHVAEKKLANRQQTYRITHNHHPHWCRHPQKLARAHV
jgi:hypothetical protein